MVSIKKLQNHGVLRSRRGLAVSWAPCVEAVAKSGISSHASLKSDQVISKEPATAGNQRALGPGLKLQATSSERFKLQAASIKPQAASIKRQAASNKLLDPGPFKKFQAPLIKGLCQDK